MTTVPEEAVKAADIIQVITDLRLAILQDDDEGLAEHAEPMIKAKALISKLSGLPHLPGVGVKAHPNITRPIVGIENRTAQEVFDIMRDRILSALEPSAARELALEEAARVAELLPECDLLNVNGQEISELAKDAFKRGAFAQGKAIAAAIRALGTSREQLNKAVSNVPDQQANEPGAHGERERALEEAVRNAAMYLATGFITCPRCGEDVETKNTDAEYTLRAALSSPDHNADAGKLVEGDGRNGRELMRQEVVLMIERFYSDYTWHHQLIANVMALPSAPSQEVAGS